ncbi:MAG: hypothetical protein HQK51_02475 [Oligoflexia bacterium]|nr:hypothetical protein [Oligoflexia bacterium]
MNIDEKIIITGVGIIHHSLGLQLTSDLEKKYIAKKDFKLSPRVTKLGLVAMGMAAEMININFYPPEDRSIFICSPSTTSELEELFPSFSYLNDKLDLKDYYTRGGVKINPLWFIRSLSNLAIALISINYNIEGVSCNWSDNAICGKHALEEGIKSLIRNESKVAIVGAFDSIISLYQQKEKICLENKNSEGAVFLILEKSNSKRPGLKAIYDLFIDNNLNTNNFINEYGNCGVATWLLAQFHNWNTIKNI